MRTEDLSRLAAALGLPFARGDEAACRQAMAQRLREMRPDTWPEVPGDAASDAVLRQLASEVSSLTAAWPMVDSASLTSVAHDRVTAALGSPEDAVSSLTPLSRPPTPESEDYDGLGDDLDAWLGSLLEETPDRPATPDHRVETHYVYGGRRGAEALAALVGPDA
jgi:hypothetical protein